MFDKQRFLSAAVALFLVLVTLSTCVMPCFTATNTVTSLPDEITAEKGKSVTVTVHAPEGSQYQWYYANAGAKTFKKSSITTNTYSVTMKDSRDGRRIYCVITDGSGNWITSDIVTLRMKKPLEISRQPENASADNGKLVQTSVAASGKGALTYQWYVRKPGGKNFYKSSVTGAVYTARMSDAANGRQVYCQITDSAGNSVTSDVVTLTLSAPIIIARQPSNAEAANGHIVKVSVKALGEGDFTYQWYVRKAGGKNFYKSAVTEPAYTARMSDAADGREVYCVITNRNGFTVTTDTVTLTKTTGHIHTFGEEIPLGKRNDEYVFLKVCSQCGREEQVYYDAILTFVDDDGKMQAMVHWERIIDATGIKMTAALIGSQMCDETDYNTWWAYSGWDLLGRLQEKGVDFVNHTYAHKRLTTLTEAELHEDFRKCKEALKQYGIESNILVYPFNAHNDLVDFVAAQYFDAAFCGQELVITDIAADPYGLTRVNINDSSSKKVIAFTETKIVECIGVKQLKTLKKDLDKALAANGWLVCLSHAYDSPSGKYYFDEESEQTIIDFCHYIQSLGNVKIVTLTEGLAAAAEME